MIEAKITAVETWKRIAATLDRSERWCRNMAARASDPLPVFRVGGIVRLNIADLEDWLDRQRARAGLPSARAEAGDDLHGEIARLRAELAKLEAELRQLRGQGVERAQQEARHG